jgi:hypothetical protein
MHKPVTPYTAMETTSGEEATTPLSLPPSGLVLRRHLRRARSLVSIMSAGIPIVRYINGTPAQPAGRQQWMAVAIMKKLQVDGEGEERLRGIGRHHLCLYRSFVIVAHLGIIEEGAGALWERPRPHQFLSSLLLPHLWSFSCLMACARSLGSYR